MPGPAPLGGPARRGEPEPFVQVTAAGAPENR